MKVVVKKPCIFKVQNYTPNATKAWPLPYLASENKLQLIILDIKSQYIVS